MKQTLKLKARFCVPVKQTLKLKARILTMQCHCGCTVRQYDLYMLPVSVHFMVMSAFKGAINLNRPLLGSSSNLKTSFIEGLKV